MTAAPSLKLRARDAADLAVVAACLQDALIRPRDMTFLAAERRFAFVANRFRWETAAGASPSGPAGGASNADRSDAEFEGDSAGSATFERVHCGVCFDRVRAVKTRGLSRAAPPEFLELLTMHLEGGSILLIFAGGVTIRLEVDGVRCHLDDLGEPWPTSWRPEHAAEEGTERDGKEPS